MPAKAKSHIHGTFPAKGNIYSALFQESVIQSRILEYFPTVCLNNKRKAGQGIVEFIREDVTETWWRPGH